MKTVVLSFEDLENIRWLANLVKAQALSERNKASALYIAYNDRDFVSRDLNYTRSKMERCDDVLNAINRRPHYSAAMNARCDGKCFTDECVCPAPDDDGLAICPLCGDPEKVVDFVGGVCLTCADGIAFEQNNRRRNTIVTTEK